MDKAIFELRDIAFSYLGKYPALRGINIEIRQGEKITLIGANGSGKSTLLHMLDGLIFPDRGIIKAFGRELRENDFADTKFSRDFRMKVGLVFQNPDIQLFCPTVKEDIIFGALQFGVAKTEIEKKLEGLLSIFKIKDLLERPPHQLSVGEKRKVAIASTMMMSPDVLILDEPTAGLDPLTTRQIIDLLIQANEAGKTIIASTHDLHVAEEISDRICVFNQEKMIVRCGCGNEILADRSLLQENNLLHIHSHRHKDKIHAHPHLHFAHHSESERDTVV